MWIHLCDMSTNLKNLLACAIWTIHSEGQVTMWSFYQENSCGLSIKKIQVEISAFMWSQMIQSTHSNFTFQDPFWYHVLWYKFASISGKHLSPASVQYTVLSSRESRNFFTSRITTNFSSMALSVSLQNEAGNFNSYSEEQTFLCYTKEEICDSSLGHTKSELHTGCIPMILVTYYSQI